MDVVLAGHNHFYARMAPAGRDPILRFRRRRPQRLRAQAEQTGYVAAGGGFYHFLYVRLTNERFEYYAIDRDGRSRDAGWWAKGDAADHAFPAGTLPRRAGLPPPRGRARPPRSRSREVAHAHGRRRACSACQ